MYIACHSCVYVSSAAISCSNRKAVLGNSLETCPVSAQENLLQSTLAAGSDLLCRDLVQSIVHLLSVHYQTIVSVSPLGLLFSTRYAHSLAPFEGTA